MIKVLSRKDLDKLNCMDPTYDHKDPDKEGIFIHSKCHIEAPPWAHYLEGVLIFTYSVCQKETVRIAIQEGELDNVNDRN